MYTEQLNDKEIFFSKSIKAGKRIYYLDVKKNRKNEMFLAITESKKIKNSEGDESQVSFEKHKIFLYKEDFEKFMDGLNQALEYINKNQTALPHKEEQILPEDSPENSSDSNKSDETIKIDIDF